MMLLLLIGIAILGLSMAIFGFGEQDAGGSEMIPDHPTQNVELAGKFYKAGDPASIAKFQGDYQAVIKSGTMVKSSLAGNEAYYTPSSIEGRTELVKTKLMVEEGIDAKTAESAARKVTGLKAPPPFWAMKKTPPPDTEMTTKKIRGPGGPKA